jgi:succinate-acetate transporter protein
MGVLCFIYMICALRTNVVFVIIFASLVPAFGLLTAAYWQLAKGNSAIVPTLEIAAGACTFVTCCCGWWIFSAIMLASLDFPFQLPGMSSPPCCMSVLRMIVH